MAEKKQEIFIKYPKLSNYFIGVVDQLKNFSIAIKTDNNIPHND